MHTHTHIHINIHIHIHIHAHTHIFLTITVVYICILNIHTACAHHKQDKYIQRYTYLLTHRHMYTYIRAYMHTSCIHKCMHTYTHSDTSYLNTYIPKKKDDTYTYPIPRNDVYQHILYNYAFFMTLAS